MRSLAEAKKMTVFLQPVKRSESFTRIQIHEHTYILWPVKLATLATSCEMSQPAPPQKKESG